MRTSGRGNDVVMVLLPLAVLLVFSVYMLGGPAEFVRFLDSGLRTVADGIARALGR